MLSDEGPNHSISVSTGEINARKKFTHISSEPCKTACCFYVLKLKIGAIQKDTQCNVFEKEPYLK